MKVLLVLCALVALTVADTCTKLQRLKVKQQWTQAYGSSGSKQRIDLGTAVWRSVFIQAPESRAIFKRVNGDDELSGEFKAHSARVLEGLGMTIDFLDNEDLLNSALAHLKSQHDERKIPARYFEVLKRSLLKVIPASLGKCFDEEAWSNCFDVIAHGITG